MMENNIMKNYYEGTEKVDGNMLVKEYNDKKAFTGVVLVGIIITGLILFVGVIYAITVIVCNSFELISKLLN
jgi:uncharacterized protein (DUF983 family)